MVKKQELNKHLTNSSSVLGNKEIIRGLVLGWMIITNNVGKAVGFASLLNRNDSEEKFSFSVGGQLVDGR